MRNNATYRVTGLDARSLIGFRIVLAAALFIDLVTLKLYTLRAVYLPSSGLFGNAFMDGTELPQQLWSPLDYVYSDALFIAVLAVYGLLLLSFLFGRGLPVVNVLIWIFFWSFQQRFHVLNYGFHTYLNALLFLSVLLPLNRVQISRRSGRFNGTELRSVWVWVALAQVACIYFFSALSKSGSTWQEGIAAHFLMADMMRNRETVCPLLYNGLFVKSVTWGTLIMEYAVGFLLFIPWKNDRFRMVAAFLILVFHWGIFLFVDVGLFPLCGTCAAMLILPARFWDGLKAKAPKLPAGSTGPMHPVWRRMASAALILVIIIQNAGIAMSWEGPVTDGLRNSAIGRALQGIRIKSPERSSFLNQRWDLYAPNPAIRTGIVDIEVVSEDVVYSYPSGRIINTGYFPGIPSPLDIRRHLLAEYRIRYDQPGGEYLMRLHAVHIMDHPAAGHEAASTVRFVLYSFDDPCVGEAGIRSVLRSFDF